MVKNLSANAGNIRDASSVPGTGRALGGGNGNPFQFYCLENLIDREACRSTTHRVAQS